MNTQKFPLSLLAVALYGVMSSAWSQAIDTTSPAQDQAGETATGQEGNEEDPARFADVSTSLDRVEVTGSRLQHGNITSRVVIIDQEEIKSRGVTSVEELVRTLPQNLATIGDITNDRSRGPLSSREKASVSAIGTLGVSAANLGGVGAGKTLVLVNGRRVAGAAGIEDGFANLNGIPLSAVERVEINLDGASAVYGADAMGGVINFILKKNHVGSTLSVQQEHSSNDADSRKISLYSGYAWNSGNVSITLDHGKRKPVNNWKSGYVTEDYSDYYDGDSYYDRRSFGRGLQPGVIDQSYEIYDPETYRSTTIAQGLSVPAGFTGVPTIDDFIVLGPEAKRDFVPKLAGPESESNSATFNFSQDITDRLRFTFNGLYSRSRNHQQQTFQNGLTLNLAPGQYYNPFPAYYFNSYTPGTTVHYYPEAEIDAGVLQPGIIRNTSTSWNANAALSYEFNADTRLELAYTTSASKTKGSTWNFNSIVSLISDPTSPNGVACYSHDLAYSRLSGEALAQRQALFDIQCRALTSSDPNLAVNPWNSSANGSGSSITDFFYLQQEEQRNSRVESYELRLNGSLYELPAGKIYYAVGGEYYEDGVSSNEVKNFTGEAVSRDRHAMFGEMTIPVFGKDYSLPGVKSLTLSAAARRDTYKTEGAIGTVDGIPIDMGGELVYGKNTFARTTPSYGFHWEINDALAFRARWSEGFQAPPYTNLFDTTGTATYDTIIFNDPLYDCNPNCDFPWSPNAYYAPRTTAPNPDLRPETSTQRSYSLSWRPQGALRGLSLDASYSRIKVDNEYANLNDLYSLLRQETIYSLEQFYRRDETGRVVGMQNMIFNILGSEYESVTYELGYAFDTRFGGLEPRLTYLDNLKAERRAFADSDPVSTLGHLQGVDDYKIIGSLRWFYGSFNATLWAYYTPEYINDYVVNMYAGVLDRPEYAKTVDSYLTWDLSLAWQMRNDLRLNFVGRNIFDSAPPFVVVETRPYDTARYNAAGRTLSLELQYDF
ncbi:TonB-dependent receptor [Stenotrophomonas sp. MMGLT7]|uniref:TonB-dependent receptor domain-containing protein n=1 Tax=Stenotrophomonas sp. MMGLT7 TaxID=2901227 RepID=UPI001E417799|nr:TonB-dependent receptor [Stenotrophomonas sp. MMGLT7]MCD7100396.1 TonB-dependent receptor [Stenotrophomonas sp. MMGLT7]